MTKVYKTLHNTYNAAVLFIDKCMKISRTLKVIYAKAKKMAIENKVDNCKAFFSAAKEQIKNDLDKMSDYCNKYGSH